MNNKTRIIGLATLGLSAGFAHAGLLNDGEFDQGETFWGKFGAADFNDFFGGDAHASFFADGNGNFGGVFQAGLASSAGDIYSFTLDNVRIEDNFNADFRFGLEFYAADDSTKLGESFFVIDTSDQNDGLVTGDSLTYSMQASAVAGASFVRPVILFDNANPVSSSQANAFVFSASLGVVPSPATLSLGLIGVAATTRRRR
ncbi:MAG: hypothetical protein AB8F26_08065 [Phycisphaerales bacterium]